MKKVNLVNMRLAALVTAMGATALVGCSSNSNGSNANLGVAAAVPTSACLDPNYQASDEWRLNYQRGGAQSYGWQINPRLRGGLFGHDSLLGSNLISRVRGPAPTDINEDFEDADLPDTATLPEPEDDARYDRGEEEDEFRHGDHSGLRGPIRHEEHEEYREHRRHGRGDLPNSRGPRGPWRDRDGYGRPGPGPRPGPLPRPQQPYFPDDGLCNCQPSEIPTCGPNGGLICVPRSGFDWNFRPAFYGWNNQTNAFNPAPQERFLRSRQNNCYMHVAQACRLDIPNSCAGGLICRPVGAQGYGPGAGQGYGQPGFQGGFGVCSFQ